MADVLNVRFVGDVIQISSDAVSKVNHESAERVLQGVAFLAGGDVKRVARGVGAAHAHGHEHSVDAAGGGHDHE